MFTPNKQSEAWIVKYLQSCLRFSKSQLEPLKERFRTIDQAYYRESEAYKMTQGGKSAQEMLAKGKLKPVEEPVIQPLTEVAASFYTATFLSGYPIFAGVGPKEYEAQTNMLTAKIENDQVTFGWVSQLQKTIKSGLKYNVGAALIDWAKLQTYEVIQDDSIQNKTKREDTLYEGNQIRHLDIYNSWWDPRHAPCEVHEKGEFTCYVEKKNKPEFKAYVNSLGKAVIQRNLKAATENQQANLEYIEPEIRGKQKTNSESWASFFNAPQPDGAKFKYQHSYECVHYYARIIPDEFGMDVPGKNTPQIWHFVLINNQTLLYAERMSNAHNFLPILFMQPKDDGLGTEVSSFAEMLMPAQANISSLRNARLAALRRSIADRAIFNPTMIDPKHLQSDNPAHKIPVRNALPGSNLNAAYMPIPFRDDTFATINQEIQGATMAAESSVGINKAQQGNFVKGNKTLEEFNTIMDNSAARLQSDAIAMEDQFFRPLKLIIKLNILQFGQNETLYQRESNQEVEVNPEEIRKATVDIGLSDGLISVAKMMNTQAWNMAFQFLSSNPNLSADYKSGELFAYLMQLMGVRNLKDFAYTAEEKTAMAEQQAKILQAQVQLQQGKPAAPAQ